MKERVLVTGSTRGIGEAIAVRFIEAGHPVVINCVSNKALMEAQLEKYKKINPSVEGFCCDLYSYEGAREMLSQVGEVDILINNAGISHVGLFHEMTPDEIQRIIGVNLGSVINCCHLVVPGMIRRKHGCIINISSIWGVTGASCEVAYSAAKGGVNTFSKALAKELGPSGIRVNAIACGVINTEMNGFLSPEEMDDLTEKIPLSRIASPSEVANLAYFLASRQAGYITGQVIGVDGGIV